MADRQAPQPRDPAWVYQQVERLLIQIQNEGMEASIDTRQEFRKLGQDAVRPLMDILYKAEPYSGMYNPLGSAFAYVGDCAVDSLTTALQHSNSLVRCGAVDALGYIKAPRSLMPVLRLLQDEDCCVRGSAAIATGYIVAKNSELEDVPTAIEALVHMLHDHEPHVVGDTVYGLGLTRNPLATEPLCTLLFDSEPSQCDHIINALSKIGDPHAVGPLCRFMQEVRPEFQSFVCKVPDALVTIGSVRAIMPLLQRSRQKDVVARHAKSGLNKMYLISGLPGKVLSEVGLTGRERYELLCTIRWECKIISVTRFCRRMLGHTNVAIREGANAVLEYCTYMRPSGKELPIADNTLFHAVGVDQGDANLHPTLLRVSSGIVEPNTVDGRLPLGKSSGTTLKAAVQGTLAKTIRRLRSLFGNE